MTGTGAVAIAVAGVIPGTVVHRLVPQSKASVRFGHPSGSLEVGAGAPRKDGAWTVTKAFVLVPSSATSR
ncbi:2-methylaconitate cis-trans-isomerase PrpF [Paraburkholderia youngii]